MLELVIRLIRFLITFPLRLIGFVITFPFKLIQFPFRLILKIFISPRIKLWPGDTKTSSGKRRGGSKKRRKSRRVSARDLAVLDDIQAEIGHQQLQGASRYPSSPKKRSPALMVFAILVILMILLAFIFAGYHV